MVYVDDFNANYRGMIMCHMIADNTKELFEMCDKIGVNKKWIQDANTWQEHFDICLSKKKKALLAGAQEIPFRQMAEMRSKRKLISIPE